MDSVLFSPEDIEELQGRGIAVEEAEAQVHDIRSGFPYLSIIASASLERGIIRVEPDEQAR